MIGGSPYRRISYPQGTIFGLPIEEGVTGRVPQRIMAIGTWNVWPAGLPAAPFGIPTRRASPPAKQLPLLTTEETLKTGGQTEILRPNDRHPGQHASIIVIVVSLVRLETHRKEGVSL